MIRVGQKIKKETHYTRPHERQRDRQRREMRAKKNERSVIDASGKEERVS